MKTITFAMMKYPCSPDFYQPCSCEESEHSLPQESILNLLESFLMVPRPANWFLVTSPWTLWLCFSAALRGTFQNLSPLHQVFLSSVLLIMSVKCPFYNTQDIRHHSEKAKKQKRLCLYFPKMFHDFSLISLIAQGRE